MPVPQPLNGHSRTTSTILLINVFLLSFLPIPPVVTVVACHLVVVTTTRTPPVKPSHPDSQPPSTQQYCLLCAYYRTHPLPCRMTRMVWILLSLMSSTHPRHRQNLSGLASYGTTTRFNDTLTTMARITGNVCGVD